MNTVAIRRHYNSLAFEEVFGSVRDSGAYAKFKNGGLKGQSETLDFCCDVDKALKTVIGDQELLYKFFSHYIMGIKKFEPEQEIYLEQKIGRELRRRGLIPVSNYFKGRVWN